MSERRGFSQSISAVADCPAVNVPSLLIRRVSVQSPKPSQHYHYHDCYELYYLHSGDRYYFIKDKTYHVTDGSLVFIEPYAIHCSSNFEKRGYDRTVIYFKRELVESVIKASGSRALDGYADGCHIHQLTPPSRALVEANIEAITKAYDKGGSTPYLKLALAQLLTFISEGDNTHELHHIEYANPTHRMMSEITGYINSNFRDNITLDDISRRFFISPCYFSRTFKSLAGLSFTEYLSNVRIKEARGLLESSDMSIIGVAEAVGFSNNTHFGRVFKRLVGVSPTKYRKRYRKE